MGTLFIILLCVFIILAAVDFHLTIKKNVVYNNMDRMYYEIENFIIKNNIKIDKDLELYLYNIKTLQVNKAFTDVQVLIMLLKNMDKKELEKARDKFKAIDSRIHPEIVKLGNQFYNEATKATRLSGWKPGFLIFLLVKTSLVLTTNVLKRSSKNIANYFGLVGKALSHSFDLERVVSARQMKMTP